VTAVPADRDFPEAAARRLGEILADLGVGYSEPQPGSFLVRLEGQHKLVTMTWLIVEAHSLHVEAFFCRQPDENHAEFYRFLLERGNRMFGLHFALDPVGDVYLVGRLPLATIEPVEIDRLLGCVLSYSDDNFDPALMIGFASSIRREWAWRVKRGESLANLRAFARLTDPDEAEPAADGTADPARTTSGGPAEPGGTASSSTTDPGRAASAGPVEPGGTAKQATGPGGTAKQAAGPGGTAEQAAGPGGTAKQAAGPGRTAADSGRVG